MKVIDLLNKIANNEIEPPLYFRLNAAGHNFIIKYLYFDFVIEDVKTSFNRSIFKKGEKFDMILSSLNKTIEIIEDKPFNVRVEEIYNKHIDYVYNKENNKIVKLKMDDFGENEDLDEVDSDIYFVVDKINEIIDIINKEKE